MYLVNNQKKNYVKFVYFYSNKKLYDTLYLN